MCIINAFWNIIILFWVPFIWTSCINLLGDNINTIKKNIEALTATSKEAGLEVNTEKTKYMLMSHHQTAG
jgi:hypothetical protein